MSKPQEVIIKKWRCPHKGCNTIHKTKKFIQEHLDKGCWYDIKQKTCKTCIYEKYYTETEYNECNWGFSLDRKYRVRECLNENLPEEIEHKIDDNNTQSYDETTYSLPVINCPCWVNKTPRKERIADFLNDI